MIDLISYLNAHLLISIHTYQYLAMLITNWTILQNYKILTQNMSFSEDELRKAVDEVFACYDFDKSGTLDVEEVEVLIKDALK